MSKLSRVIITAAFALSLMAMGAIRVWALSIPLVNIPDEGYLFDTTLQSSIGTTDTSMTLVSAKWKDGTVLSGYQCFTIDIGTPQTEYVCGTASSTAITSLVRGIQPLSPSSTAVSLEFKHRAGADVRITDFPGLQIQKRLVNGQDPFPTPLFYDNAVSTSTLAGNPLNLADVAYVNGTTLQGAPTATNTTPGIVEIANQVQMSNGVQNVGGYQLVAPNWFFNATPQSATTVPVTLGNGKLAQGFLDLTQSFTPTGAWTFNSATTTFNASSTFLTLPTIQAGTPSATLATQLVPKQYVDALVSTLATSTETISGLTMTHNTTSTSTGMTLITDGKQSLVISYEGGVAWASSDSQSHTDTCAILLDNVVQTSYNCWSVQPSSATNYFPIGINYITPILSAGSHTIKFRIADVSSGTTNGSINATGMVYTIR